MPSSDLKPAPGTRYNRRRVVVFIVILFVAVISFFAGRFAGGKTYIQPANIPSSAQPGSDRANIPPDSLPQ